MTLKELIMRVSFEDLLPFLKEHDAGILTTPALPDKEVDEFSKLSARRLDIRTSCPAALMKTGKQRT